MPSPFDPGVTPAPTPAPPPAPAQPVVIPVIPDSAWMSRSLDWDPNDYLSGYALGMVLAQSINPSGCTDWPDFRAKVIEPRFRQLYAPTGTPGVVLLSLTNGGFNAAFADGGNWKWHHDPRSRGYGGA
jgi:hypothetical protein